MRPTLRAVSARLIVGHLDPEQAVDLLAAIDGRDQPITFALAEPDGLRLAAAVPAGEAAEAARPEPLRWGKLLLETVANEQLASPRKEVCDAIVDGLRVAHHRLGPEGLDQIPHGSFGVGFCAAALVDGGVQLVVVPPAQIFVLHQGVALSVPESDEVGRGIWMRDDLRAEIFAGIGGLHEPDIRVYDAAIGPGDTLVLASSGLARMLTEEDVRLAVTYEEAATGAERLKQLAVQRGVEAGVALVVEIAGSLEPPQASSTLPRPLVLNSLHRPSLRIEMPPIGSIFSTARDWLLDALDRIQPTQASNSAGIRREEEVVDIRWPVRPQPGAWCKDFQAMKRIAISGRRQPAEEHPEVQAQSSAVDDNSSLSRPAPDYAALSAGWRRQLAQGSRRYPSLSVRLSPALQGRGTAVAGAIVGLGRRLGSMDLGRRRHLLVPALGAMCVLLVFLGAMRTVKAQQARQLQQRFDSLVTAATQLEAQARTESDRGTSQGLVRRAQALLDQAASLEPNQPRVAGVRKDLQADLDRLDGIVPLGDPALLASFAGLGRDVNATALAGDAAALYALDGGGQRLLQLARQSKQASIIASKGDKSGPNQLAAPKLLAVRENGLLVLDTSRNLWSYSPSTKQLAQIGLKSADSWREPAAMAAYGPNLYILDTTLGNIFRYTSRDGLFGDPPSRILEKDNPDQLRQGVSLSVDGSFWVLGADGQIVKLENGARQPFAVTGLPQPLSKPTQLHTEAGWRSLFVLSTGNNRVVEIAKDGRYLRQFALSGPATAVLADEPGHQLYVLSGNSLYQYQLPV